VSSSIPFALAQLTSDGELAGRTVLLSGFGVGLSWASTIVRFDH
jgi:3-oxoacyl-[acyl-carrier-protein] synthase III